MGDKIRVFYLIVTLDVGGSEGQLLQLATRLDRRRFEVVVGCLSAAGPYVDALTQAGIPVHVLGMSKFRALVRPDRALGQLLHLARILRQRRPHVFHGFLFWAYSIGAVAARLAKTPVVVASRRSLGNFKASKPHYRWIERVCNRMTDLVIANSEEVRQDTLRREGLADDKVIVIHNGVSLEPYSVPADDELRASLELSPENRVVAVLANLIRYKGHHHFIQAWPRIVQEKPGARALLIGDGPERERLERQARAVGVQNSIRFLGIRKDVPSLLALADLVVHPSLEEGFSNAILEAMAAGRPLVATRVGGNTEAVVDGVTGLLVPAGDESALTSAVLSLLKDASLAARFGEAGRRRVAENFEVAGMVRGYQAVYEQLVAKKRSGCKR